MTDQKSMRPRGLDRRQLFAVAGSAGLMATVAPSAMAQTATPHSLVEFFQYDRLISVALSPSGEKIALLKETRENGERLALVDVFSVNNLSQATSRSRLGDFQADQMDWANDERLLIGLIQIVSRDARVRSDRSTITDEQVTHVSRRMISLDTVNGGAVVLFENQPGALTHSIDLGRVVDLLPSDPDHILMMSREGQRQSGYWIPASSGRQALYRVNVNTGDAERIEAGTDQTIGWRTHAGVPVIRVDISPRGTYETLYARVEGTSDWRLLTRRRVTETPEFEYISNGDRPNVILVAARRDGEDTSSVRTLDLTSMTYGPPLTARRDRDVSYGVLDDTGRYLGAAFYADRLEYEIAGPLGAQHRALNGYFGGNSNVHFWDVSRDHNRLLLRVSGPQDPGSWHLYDVAGRHVEALGARIPLEVSRLSPTEAIDVSTRDGRTIRAYLTGPLHGRPAPLVVLLHGGPEIRDALEWDRQVQVLAAQGWWVLQPNFRGSGGYGQAFAQAGWREWGGKMQTDVEDAVARAIQLKGLDTSKVAIMGASYGGYAALMGAVLRPDLYKAAIGIAGDYDLVRLLEHERDTDDTPDNFVYGVWSNRIGDLQRDRALIEAASPRRRVNEIQCPVLLVHGEWDQIVPISQSERMESALNGAGKSVDFVRVRNAGHGDWVDDVDVELWRRYVEFLQRAFA
ncbi:alpha/beta hydrolase family protein [Brevundimonas aveniformis]|uniref:alpha/beta hydrolase family protein n=1 Tax=Brevundimonas aveniformis TaxID=370977 RepID=UPI00040B1E53|nr:alpha/beta fold hydrolase [Brevundimonas aveniformis]